MSDDKVNFIVDAIISLRYWIQKWKLFTEMKYEPIGNQTSGVI